MSATWTQHVNPAVEAWLGKPILVVEAERCGVCGRPSAELREQEGWSLSLGEHLGEMVCPACRGEDDG